MPYERGTDAHQRLISFVKERRHKHRSGLSAEGRIDVMRTRTCWRICQPGYASSSDRLTRRVLEDEPYSMMVLARAAPCIPSHTHGACRCDLRSSSGSHSSHGRCRTHALQLFQVQCVWSIVAIAPTAMLTSQSSDGRHRYMCVGVSWQ